MADFTPLFDYIEKKSSVTLSDDERGLIMNKLKPKKLRKRQFFLQEGDVCKYMGFIIKGATRMFSVDERGHEHILHFGMEDWWVGDYESFHLLTPSKYYVEALEDTEMLLITSEQLNDMVRSIRAIAEMLESLGRGAAIANNKRMHAAISLTAEERYEDLAKTYPYFFNRFPQNMIASYLGISPETLSRIRKMALKA
ncbi:Crp/Fnr family transcriptional regulator [Mucilaginibacter sp. X4EP1]|uniref:Crp/Fnr family transcriptional regulator n=1 Tax=Mucilaginibacter sp. X4EP1 TaxID=2723092 RepID=UPI0021679A86|nr:Crp/Fnr family transcriptional regulator [Mucilaginibacter sp. X4EP1]MCS3811980.1 CRP-like cAMP-binding protein [Mucilaginibacter sp. X4EP1]